MPSLADILQSREVDGSGELWKDRLARIKVPISTAEQLLTRDTFDLAQETSLQVTEIENLKKMVAARKLFGTEMGSGLGMEFGWQQLHSLLDVPAPPESNGGSSLDFDHDQGQEPQAEAALCIPTGHRALDDLFNGGLPKNCTISILGDSASGKTNLAISIAVINAIKGDRVMIIDTCNGISVRRIRNMAQQLIEAEMRGEGLMVADKQEFKTQVNRTLSAILTRVHVQVGDV
jgi:hypothetical protein